MSMSMSVSVNVSVNVSVRQNSHKNLLKNISIFPLFICFLISTLLHSRAYSLSELEKQTKSTLLNNAPAYAQPYCLALRGNGELLPAHFGALAATIENFGIPSAMAGGSSASISTFLLESMLMNPIVMSSHSAKEKALLVAYMMKSLEGMIEVLMELPQLQNLRSFLSFLSSKGDLPPSLQEFISQTTLSDRNYSNDINFTPDDLLTAVNLLLKTDIFFGPASLNLFNSLKNNFGIPISDGIKNQLLDIQKSISVFGNFDAKNDNALFLREALINFDALAMEVGRLGNFLSLRGIPSTHPIFYRYQSYLKRCSNYYELWKDINAMDPSCKADLASLLNSYFEIIPIPQTSPATIKNLNAYSNFDLRINDSVGSVLPTLITTSVLMNDDAKNLRNFQTYYIKQRSTLKPADFLNWLNKSSELNFEFDSNNVFFGYWGLNSSLNEINNNFKDPNNPSSAIFKSRKFMSLGPTTWREALRISPAEPGLSAFSEFHPAKINALSLGGWSDLHPVPVLKALGCPKVVYVTRKGGDSIFVAGIAKRIFRFNLDWKYLDPKDQQFSQPLANQGSIFLKQRKEPIDETWSSMFDLSNPNSSISFSIAQSDAVVCTNWNSFNIRKDLHKMISEAYYAPIFNPGNVPSIGLKQPFSSPRRQTYDPNDPNEIKASTYEGCTPLKSGSTAY